MITLYGTPLSGNTHKVRIALALLGLPWDERLTDAAARQSDAFRALTPMAQIPLYVDGDVTLRDSQAILAFLAARHRAGAWDGHTPEERGEIYESLAARMRAHLGRYPESSTASYWLPAAALARGDLELAWDLALAGWVRSTLAPEGGASLRADIDRLVTQALIPERVKRLGDEAEAADAATRFTGEWEEAKGRWKHPQ